jgi:hypothetical protein
MPLQRSTGGATGFSRALQTPSFLMGLRPSTLVLLHILLQNRIFPPNNRDSLLYTTVFCTHLPSYQLPPRRSHSSASSPFISPTHPPTHCAAAPPSPAGRAPLRPCRARAPPPLPLLPCLRKSAATPPSPLWAHATAGRRRGGHDMGAAAGTKTSTQRRRGAPPPPSPPSSGCSPLLQHEHPHPSTSSPPRKSRARRAWGSWRAAARR